MQERAGALGFDDLWAYLQARCDTDASVPGIAAKLGVSDWQVQAALPRRQVRLAPRSQRLAVQRAWPTRLGRGYAEGLGLIARVEKEVWQAGFIAPLLASGADQHTAMEAASLRDVDLNFTPLVDRALLAAYHRQQELSRIEQLVEDIEAALEETGVLGRPGRVPAMCLLTWWATPG